MGRLAAAVRRWRSGASIRGGSRRRRTATVAVAGLLATLALTSTVTAADPNDHATALLDALDSFATVTSQLESLQQLADDFPLTDVDPSGLDGLELGSLLTRVIDALPAGFNTHDPLDATGRRDLRNALEDLDAATPWTPGGGDVAVRVGCAGTAEDAGTESPSCATAGQSPVTVVAVSGAGLDRIDVVIPVAAQRTISVPVDAVVPFGAGRDLELRGGTVDIDLTMATTLAFRLDPNLVATSPLQAVAVTQVGGSFPSLAIGGTVTTADDVSVAAHLGFTDVSVTLHDLAANLAISAQLQDPDGDGLITEDEWTATAVGDLITLSRSGAVSGELDVDTSLTAASPDIADVPFSATLDDTTSFVFPEVDLGPVLPDFTNITPEQVITAFGQAASAIDGAQQAADVDLPFIREGLSKAVKVAQPVIDVVEQQSVICGTSKTAGAPPTGDVSDLPAGTEVYCQAFAFTAPQPGTISWSVPTGVPAAPAASGANTSGSAADGTIAPAPTTYATFVMSAAGAFDATATYDVLTADGDTVTKTTQRPARTAQQLFAKIGQLGGFEGNLADYVDYDTSKKALTFRLKKTLLEGAERSFGYDFGDQLDFGTGLVGLQTTGAAGISVKASDIALDTTVGVILHPTLSEIGTGQPCPIQPVPSGGCPESELDRFFVAASKEGTTAQPLFTIGDGTFTATAPELVGRLGFLEVTAEGKSGEEGCIAAICIEKKTATDPLAAVALTGMSGVAVGPSGSTTTIPDAIRLRELLFQLPDKVSGPNLNLTARGGLEVEAKLKDDTTSLGKGVVSYDWPDVTQGLPTVTAKADFLDQLKDFDLEPNLYGTHSSTTSSATVLTDSSRTFPAEAVGKRLDNLTDGSYCTVASVSGGTATCEGALAGGSDNTWQQHDKYRLQVGDPLALLWMLLDNLDAIVTGIDGLTGAGVGDTLDTQLPLVGISPKDIIGQIRAIKRGTSEIRGGPGAAITCGTQTEVTRPDGTVIAAPSDPVTHVPPIGDPSDLTDVDPRTVYCSVTSPKPATEVEWSIEGGSVTANGTDVATVGATKNAVFSVTSDQLASRATPAGYRIRAVFRDADGEHVVDYPELSVPPTLQEFETAIERKLGLPDGMFALGMEQVDNGSGAQRTLTVRLKYARCTGATAEPTFCTGITDDGSANVSSPVRTPFNLDLGTIAGFGEADLVGVGASGEVEVSYALLALLGLAIPITSNPSPRVLDDTGVTVKARANSTSIALRTSLGPISLRAGTNGKNGDAGTGQLKLGADLALGKSGGTSTSSSAIGSFSSSFTAAFAEAGNQSCGPITGDLDKDPATPDTTGNVSGFACGVLSLGEGPDGSVEHLGDLGFEATGLTGSGDFDVETYLPSDLGTRLAERILSWDMLLRAIPMLLSQLEQGLSAAASGGTSGGNKIPIIGDALDAGADVVGTMRAGFDTAVDEIGAFVDGVLEAVPSTCVDSAGEPTPCLPENTDGTGCTDDDPEQCTEDQQCLDGTDPAPCPEQAEANPTHVEGAIREFLWDELGPDSAVKLLRNAAGDGPAADAATDVGVTTLCGTTPDPCTADHALTDIVDVRLTIDVGQGLTARDGLPFDVGLDGVPLRVAGGIDAQIGWNLLVDLGLNRNAGPYLVTKDDTGPRPDRELQVGGTVRLKDDSSLPSPVCGTDIADPEPGTPIALDVADRCLTGKIGFVAANLRDAESQRTELSIQTYLDLQRKSGDLTSGVTKLGMSDLVGGELKPVLGFDTTARINLRFRTGVPSDQFAGFPSVIGTFRLDWAFSTSTETGATTVGTPLTVAFGDLYLDASEFVDAYLDPILAEIRNITGPFKPVIDTLNAPIPVVSDLAAMVGADPITLLSLMQAVSSNNLTVIQSLAAFIQFANNPLTVEGFIPLGQTAGAPGSFKVDPTKAKTALSPGQASAALTDVKGGSDLFSRPTTTGDDSLKTASSEPPADSGDQLPGTFGVPGLTFPFMADSSQIFGFVMGQDITLIRYDVGTLRATAGFSYDFGPFFIGPVPLTAGIGGAVTLAGRFAMGYDTSGLRKVMSGGSGVYLFDGIFIDDLDAAGVDVAEITLTGEVYARAGVTLFVATAGIEGGIRLTVALNLDDRPEPDGKLRIEEVFNKLSNPICLFDVSGSLIAFLRAFLEINYFVGSERWDFTLVELELLNFSGACAPPRPVLAVKTGSTLVLNMGSEARRNARKVATTTEDERFVVRPVNDASPKSYSVSAFGVYQIYHGIDTIYADGDSGNDTILLEPGSNEESAAGTVIAFTARAVIRGGAANDTIVGGDADDAIDGGPGDDNIDGGKGDDLILGGTGIDTIKGGPGTDVLLGGGDGDRLNGGPGADYVDGGDGNDFVSGGPGVSPDDPTALDEAKDGADLLIGGAGKDNVEGGWGRDLLYGDEDLSAHGSGGFAIDGGLHTALAAAATGKTANGDTINAPGLTPGTASTSACTTDGAATGDIDVLDGGPGDDLLLGGAANDKLVGGRGNDTLCGNGGDDELDGDDPQLEATGGSDPASRGGNDDLTGGTGDDVLFGRGGHDRLWGSDGHDVLRGGGGSDHLLGEGGNDDVSGGDGRDVLDGGDGLNVLVGDDATIADSDRSSRVSTPENRELRIALVSNVGTRSAGIIFPDCAYVRPGVATTDTRTADCLTGGANDDVMFGEGGDDRIVGDAGPDYVRGGSGDDHIQGDAGDDELHGDSGNDDIFGGDDQDLIRGGIGADRIEGNGGADEIHGDADDDDIVGGSSTAGEEDDDVAIAGLGTIGDRISGGQGDDVIAGDNASIDATTRAVTLYDLDSSDSTRYGADTIDGGDGDDRVYGGGQDDTLTGGAGNDYIEGNGGSDDMQGDGGDDDLVGGTSVESMPDAEVDRGGTLGTIGDRISGGAGTDVIAGDNACIAPSSRAVNGTTCQDETVRAVTLFDVTTVGTGARTADTGFSGGDHITGDAGADTIFGQGGDDTIAGGADADLINGNGGTDTIDGDGGADLILGGSSQHATLVASLEPADASPLPSQDDRVVAYGVAADARDVIRGGDGDDILLGDDASADADGVVAFLIPTPAGSYGDDEIHGDAGDDRIWGQLGDDEIHGGTGHDHVLGDLGTFTPEADPLTFWPGGAPRYTTVLLDPEVGGADTVFGDEGDDHLYGGADADHLEGGTGDDHVEGNGGADVLYGLSASWESTPDVTLSAGLGSTALTDEDDLIGGSSRVHPDALGDGAPDAGDHIVGNAGQDVILGDNGEITPLTDGAEWATDTVLGGGRGRDVELYDRTRTESTTRPLSEVSGGDTLFGNHGNDRIHGGGGDDHIRGGANDDYLEGNQGRDWIEGNDGRDDLIGGSAETDGGTDPDAGDLLYGGAGQDVIVGDNAAISRATLSDPYLATDGRVVGFSPNRWVVLHDLDSLSADRYGADLISGGAGDDIVLGQDGDDWLSGGSEADHVEGNGGDDVIIGDDLLEGLCTGTDPDVSCPTKRQLEERGGVPAVPASLIALQAKLDGLTAPNDPVPASSTAVREGTQGAAGQDDLVGGSDLPGHRDGDDLVYGDGSHDFATGDNGRISRHIDTGAYVTYEASWNTDRVARRVQRYDVGTSDADVYGDDHLEGGDGDDALWGQDGHDRIWGQGGDDELFGEMGDDGLFGGSGEDALIGDRGGVVNTLITAAMSGDPEHRFGEFTVTYSSPPFLTFTGFWEGTRDRRVDLLAERAGSVGGPLTGDPVSLAPADGRDHGGNDTMRGGPDHDVLHGGWGDDLMNGDSGGDTLFGGNGSDVMWGGRGDNDLAEIDRRGEHDSLVDYLFGGRSDGAQRSTVLITGGADVLDYRPRDSDPATWHDAIAAYDDPNGAVQEAVRQVNQGIDWIYGGWHRDVMQADTAGQGPNDGDRLIDWSGAFNLYTHCEPDYGGQNDIHTPSPAMEDFLQRLAYGLGAGATLAEVTDPSTSAFNALALVYKEDVKANSGQAYPDTPGHFTNTACTTDSP